MKFSGSSVLRNLGESLLRSRRRGSFLVLVVGTLAMLSIIMIVYVTVGNSDKRASASLERRNRTQEVIGLFSDYVAQIIADDAVAVSPDPSNTSPSGVPLGLAGGDANGAIYLREAWDAPVTNWNVSSTVPPGTTNQTDKARIFRTVGAGDDPWLASTTPTWINYDPASSGTTHTGADGNNKVFAKRRDWLHITNIAPDGRFVNLFNLRDHFDAPPGTLQAAGESNMNANLSLTDQDGAMNANSAWNAPVGSGTDTNSKYQNPSTFDSWQVGAFRPARGPFKAGATDILPNNAAYPPYQWADADGDGFFDSRWFEMIDSRDVNQTGGISTPQFFRRLLPTDPNFRWVFATRVVDLSALVNVNTAGDDNANPNDLNWSENPSIKPANGKNPKGNVMGLNPTDIDLRRLLSMRDTTETVLSGSAIGAVQIDGNAYNGGYSAIASPFGGKPESQDYTKYSNQPQGAPPLGLMEDLGWGAYESLRATVNVGRAPGRFSDFSKIPLVDSKESFASLDARAEFYRRAAPSVARPAYRDLDTSRGDPTSLFVSGSGGIQSSTTGAIDFGMGFRISNLLELFTFRSVNDPSVSSTLESALGGRLHSEMSAAPVPADLDKVGASFGPLRENRSLELERENLTALSGPNLGKPTEAAMLKSYADVRQYLTTLSGARPIRATTVSVGSIDFPPALTSSDLSTEVPSSASADTLFHAYSSALLPGMKLYRPEAQGPLPAVDTWGDISTGAAQQLRGMFYGGQGPITALLAAGHMAANFASGAQEQSGTASRAPYVLVMSEPVYADSANCLPQDTQNIVDWKKYYPSWWTNPDRRLNLARLQTPTAPQKNGAEISVNKAAPIPAPAVNIYGMGDPHPFLTDVATITVYRDVAPGDPIDFPQRDQEGSYVGAPSLPQSITVNGYLSDNNPDFLFRALAVKVHNPYQTPIVLSKDLPSTSFKIDGSGAQFAFNSLSDFFYLQIGSGADSTYFVLAEVDETKSGGSYGDDYTLKPVVILPGETIVFYALSRDKKHIVFNRFNGTDAALKFDQSNPLEFDNWLETQIGPKAGTQIRRVQMARVDNENFRTGGANAYSTFALSTNNSTQLVPPYTGTTPPDSTVYLRRAVRIDSGDFDDSQAGSLNRVLNDELCDRLRLGSEFVLDRRLFGKPPSPGVPTFDQSMQIVGLYARDRPNYESPLGFRYNAIDYSPSYNTRFTVALVEHVGRKGDAAGTNLKPGMLPAWAIDPKDAPAGGTNGWYSKTQFPDPQTVSGIKLTEPIVMAQTDKKTSGWTPVAWRVLGAYIPSMPLRAEERSEKLPASKFGDFEALRRELAVNGNRYEGYTDTWQPDGISQIRPTDLLNVMAIGSTHVPLDITGAPLEDSPGVPNLMKQWTTTAEALAIAMGYADRTKYDYQGGQTAYGPLDYFYFDQVSPSAEERPLFDGGFLKLDDFVPVRTDSSGKIFTAGVGAPIAGNILCAFRVHPDSFASLQIATPGLVNINTAPQAVLRVLPMVFPSTNPFVSDKDKASGRAAASTFWFGNDESERAQEAPKTDIAAMIESYRDKIAVELRPMARNISAGAGAPTWFAGFFDRAKQPLASTVGDLTPPNDPAIGDYPLTFSTGMTFSGGRYWSSGIRGIREGSGLQSLGELLAVRHVEFDPATTVVQTAKTDLEKRSSNIDFIGYRASPSNMLGIDNMVEREIDAADPANPTTTNIKPLQFGGTYQDRLKVLSGLLGSVSVRSDMYAVWFVARGYQRSDVEGLPAAQPMVPSVERRFLMIIDRSNVTKVGQKPRVLAFVELPL